MALPSDNDRVKSEPAANVSALPVDAAGVSNFRALIFMLTGAALIAVLHVLVRDVTQDLHPFVVAFYRNLIAFLVLTPLLLRQDRSAWKSKRPGLQAVRAFIGLGAMLTWFYALSIVPVGDATALSFTVVLFTSLGAVLVFKERMGVRRWSALAIGFLGVLLILRPGFQDLTLGYGVVMISTVLWASALLFVKFMSRFDSPITLVFYSTVYFTPLSLVFALPYWEWPTTDQLILLGVIGTLAALGHLCMAKALQMGEASAIMPADFTRLLWAAALGYLLFGEFPDVMTWVGGVVIFLSTLYITYREARLRKAA